MVNNLPLSFHLRLISTDKIIFELEMDCSLHVYLDALSQPTRSVLLLLKYNNIPFHTELIEFAAGGHLTEEFAKINPCKAVPAIRDGEFQLFESEAILKYICAKQSIPDHWYPKDIQARAKIDEYLSWHHTNTRIAACDIIWGKVFTTHFTGQPEDEKRTEAGKKRMLKCVHLFDNHFLKNTTFISSEKISIADLMALCEFSQLAVLEKDFVQLSPTIEAWLKRCKDYLGATYDEVHTKIQALAEKIKAGPKN